MKTKKKEKSEEKKIPEVFECGRLLKLRFSQWQGRKKVDQDKVECKPGDDGAVAKEGTWDARKSLVDRDKAILPINRVKGQTVAEVERRMVPGWDDRASFFIAKNDILSTEALLKEMSVLFYEKVETLHKEMENLKAEARVNLGPLYNPEDYPDDVRNHFKMSWNWLKVTPENGDDVLPPEMQANEIDKFKDMMGEFRETAMFNLRLAFKEVVGEIVEGLTSGSKDGKRKVIRGDFVESRVEKIQHLSSLNVFQDGDLEKEIENLQRILNGVDIEDLKEDEKFKKRVRTEVGKISKAVRPWMDDAPIRRIIRPSRLKHLDK